MQIYKSFIFLGLGLTQSLFAQKYQMGLPAEPDPYYDNYEVKATLTNDNYRDIGSSASVKAYAPIPQSQGQYGTCAAWACAFAGRTILEAKRLGVTDKKEINKHIFSYGFAYRQAEATNYKCWGAYTGTIIENMQQKGIPKLSDYKEHCPQSDIPQSVVNLAKQHRIKGFARLWDEEDGHKLRISALKKSISEGNPVIISMICPNSFFSPTGDVWTPKKNEALHAEHGRHAMCAVSYDDNKYGGAVEVQNSWGDDWGDGGYVWIRYADFAQFVYQAFELHNFDPIVEENKEVQLSGALQLVLDTGQEMKAELQDDNTFKVDRAYRSGTRFRIYINNNEPAYVYAFGSDLTNKTYQVFPHKPNVSAALPYKKNQVAIPSEDKHIRMDKNVGTDYLCVLYSKEPLNLEDIQTAFKKQNARLSFKEKIQAALGSKLFKDSELTCADNGKMSFNGKAKGRSVVALITEIEHID